MSSSTMPTTTRPDGTNASTPMALEREHSISSAYEETADLRWEREMRWRSANHTGRSAFPVETVSGSSASAEQASSGFRRGPPMR
jgi:hypothetical protein